MRSLTAAATRPLVYGRAWAWVGAAVIGAVVVATLARVGAVPVAVGTGGVHVAVIATSVVLMRDGARHGRRGRGRELRAAAVGVFVGAVLGAHLLICTALTVGHRVRLTPVSAWLPWVLYDTTVNIPTAELLCGVVFMRAWRASPLGTATLLTSGIYVARYLVDPLLPWSVETIVGAVFYLGLLGVAACLLRAWSGGRWASAAAALVFFAAYRLVAVW